MNHNLVAVRELQAKGVSIHFPAYTKRADLSSDQGHLCTFNLTADNLYSLIQPPDELVTKANTTSQSTPEDTLALHHRLGHTNFQSLKTLHSQSMVTGLPSSLSIPTSTLSPTCTTCTRAKLQRASHPSNPSRAQKPLDIVHMDLWGPNRVKTTKGQLYFLIIIDDHSRYGSLFLLQSKDQAKHHIKQWITQARTQVGRPVLRIHSDGGGEFLNSELLSYYTSQGITHTYTLPNSPQQNGIAEARNKRLTQMARCLLIHANAPLHFWGYAVQHACSIINHLPTAILPTMTPFEAWTGQKPDIKHLKIWGCTAHVLLSSSQFRATGGKLAPISTRCMYLGSNSNSSGYLFHDPSSPTHHKEIRSGDVSFDEAVPFFSAAPPAAYQPPVHSLWEGPRTSEPIQVIQQPHFPHPQPCANNLPEEDNQHEEPILAPQPLDEARRSRRLQGLDPEIDLRAAMGLGQPRAPPALPPVLPDGGDLEVWEDRLEEAANLVTSSTACNIFTSYHTTGPTPHTLSHPRLHQTHKLLLPRKAQCLNVSIPCPVPEPETLNEALTGPNSEEWLQAMLTELGSFTTTGTFTPVDRPTKAKVIGGKWTFRVKWKGGTSPVEFKARYVAQGFTQRKGIDFVNTWAPTAKMTTARVLLHIAASEDMHIHAMDVSSAFLQGDLQETVYLEPPKGVPLPHTVGQVWLLKRPVYGLKQAPREWHIKFKSILKSLGFSPSFSDPSLFLKPTSSGFHILVYVDDMILAAHDLRELEDFKKELSQLLKMKDLGELTHYLGMEVIRDREKRTITLTQSAYIQSLLLRFGMADCELI